MEAKNKPTTAIEVALKEIAEILATHCPLISIYCFGLHCNNNTKHDILAGQCATAHRHDHFMLFACAEKLPQNATANLMDIVATETEGNYTCTLLLHTHKQLATAKPDQKHFYRDVLEKGWLIAGEALDAEKLKLTNLPEKDTERIRKFVLDRRMLASSLLLEPAEGDETLLVAVTVHAALELLFLSGIYAHLQYRPNHFHLKYLYDLFQFCCPIPDCVFPASFFEQDQFQEILNTNYNDLRFRGRNVYELEDVLSIRIFARHLFGHFTVCSYGEP